MAQATVDGAVLTCSFGTVPCTLRVTSQQSCLACGRPAATIQDMAGKTNISGFGMCTSLANPQVAAATAAALDVLTPQPCNCMTAAPWINPGKAPLVKKVPGLRSDAKLMCVNGMGVISITAPGQFKVNV